MVRGIQFGDDGAGRIVAPPPAAVVNAAPADTAIVDDELRVVAPASPARDSRGTRNLFAYVEEPPPAPVRAVVVEAQPVFVPPPVVAPVVQEKRRLPFAYRYIGTFGPDRHPVAAFARDGEIVTVRVGDRIGEHFVLRRIGIESAEIEAMVDGDVQTERVALSAR
jgi:hypothetical protein